MISLKKQITKNLYLLTSIFAISIILVLIINLVSNYISQNLNQEINKQKNRIIVGEIMLNKLSSIESNFYKIRGASKEDQKKFSKTIEKEISLIENYLKNLREGGKIHIANDPNITEETSSQKTLELPSPKISDISIESIELFPKLSLIKERLQTIPQLQKNSTQEELELFYKQLDTTIVSMKRNSNRLLYDSNKEAVHFQEMIHKKLRHYELISYILIFIIFIIAWFLFRKILHTLEEINSSLEEKTTMLSQTKDQLSTMMDTVKNIILITNGRQLERSNRAFSDFFGFTQKEYEEFKEEKRCICEFFISSGDDEFLTETIDGENWIDYIKNRPEQIHKAKILSPLDDKIHYFKADSSKISFGGQARYIVVFTDITEIETYQRSLELIVKEAVDKNRKQDRIMAEQAKMAAIGEMMRNIAHHWRQPLNIIALNIQDLADTSTHKELNDTYLQNSAEATLKQISYMSETIDNFRNFFTADSKATLYNVSSLLSTIKKLIEIELSNLNITFEIECDPNITFLGIPSELKQVILNLINNSRDAILKREDTADFGKISIKASQTPKTITLQICDNGGGIDGEIISRIFEPYFTTKFKSQGTGIGLYMVKTVIEKSLRGTILAHNISNGVCFTIELPNQKNSNF